MSASDYAESDEKPVDRYHRLLVELEVDRAQRRAAGGVLGPAEEARRKDALDRVWWAMTDDERDDYERSLGHQIARAWRKGRVVRLPPPPPHARGLSGWLRGYLLLPRWLVLTGWALHGVLLAWLGRISVGWF